MYDENHSWEHQWLADQIWSQTSFELNHGGFQHHAWPEWAAQLIQSVWLPGHVDLSAVHATQMAALLTNENHRELM